MKKVLAMILALVLGLSLLTGCTNGGSETPATQEAGGETQEAGGETEEAGGETQETAAPAENGLPLTEEKQELSMWLSYSGSIVSDLNDIEGVKKMEELTNVHINWIPVENQQKAEQIGIVLTSGDYPDIINTDTLPGGYEKLIEDGVIRDDHDELIHKYMPNYLAYLEANPIARKQATSDDGKLKIVRILAGEDFNVKAEGVYNGVCYRKDILEKLGLEEPKSIDEWHDALVKAKESGMEHPFVLHQNGGSWLSMSWGVNTVDDLYLQMDGDKVVGSAVQDGFGEYLETMRQWYEEGLIDPNFTSFNYYLSTPGSVEDDQYLLYSFVLSAFTGNNYFQMHMCNNEPEYLQPVIVPSVHGSETYMAWSPVEAKDQMFITTACKNPELAAKWMDFFYSKEGELLNWYGIEDVTYTMDENGIPQFTDFVLNNPDGTPAKSVLEKYCLGWGECWTGKHNTLASEKIATAAAGGTNQQKEAVDIWTAADINIGVPRGYTLTEEESSDINSKLTAVQTLIQEYEINYILGTDNTSFDEFKEKVMQYGYQDVIDTYQAAVDRFNAR